MGQEGQEGQEGREGRGGRAARGGRFGARGGLGGGAARTMKISRSEITEQNLYLNRRAFVRAAIGTAATAAAAMGGTQRILAAGHPAVHGQKIPNVRTSRFSTDQAPTRWDGTTRPRGETFRVNGASPARAGDSALKSASEIVASTS